MEDQLERIAKRLLDAAEANPGNAKDLLVGASIALDKAELLRRTRNVSCPRCGTQEV